MKGKKLFAAALALLMMLTLLPGAWAAENLQFLTDEFAGLQGVSLRDMIDENKTTIEIAGSGFPLENVLFLEECLQGEELELCLCETNKDAVILDESGLPEGCRVELRQEKLRIPDTKDGLEVAEEIRLEKAGKTPEPKDTELNSADPEQEAYYLYLIGKPAKAGYSLFVIWDGKLRLCSVEVVTEKPVHEAEPAVQQEWVEELYNPQAEQGGDTIPVQDWVDTSIPLQEPTPEPTQEPVQETWQEQPVNPPTPAFVLPTPSVSVTGAATVRQGESAVLEAQVSDGYNTSYQWFRWLDSESRWEPVSGAAESRYRPDTGAVGTSAYLCQVTNNGENNQTTSAYSEPVVVSVEAEPVQPALPTPSVSVAGSTKVTQGDSAVLEVSVTNAYNASYQWYENSVPISGATGSQYQPDTSKTGTQTYVCEVTSNAYGQTATAYSEPVTFTVEAKPTLPTPSVTITGGTSAYTGDRAVLEAKVNNAFNVSFQWYVGLGNYWTPIEDGTGNSAQYRPDTTRAGNYAYLCRVVSSGYGQTTYADSEPVVFTVTERNSGTSRPGFTPTPSYTQNPGINTSKLISSVSVAKLPNKVDYYDGDAVDATGLQIRVRYTDGSYDVVNSGYVVTTTNVSYNNSGLADVYVNFRGYQTSFQVKVHSYSELIRSIGVLTMPNKTSYNVGETLNTNGLMIRVYSTDGRYLDVGEGFECSPTRLNTPGNQTVTVSFGGKTCTFTVAVQQQRQVYGLSVQNQPANRTYTVGDTINTAGLTLQLQTSNGTQTVTSGYTIAPRVATTAGTQQITVNYEGLSTTFTINVTDNIPRPTPTQTPLPFGVTPSPAPYGTTPSPAPFGTVSPSPAVSPSGSPAPTRTPTYTPAPTRKNTGVSTLVKVLFVVAVLALGGLIGYVLYLRGQGDEEQDYSEPRFSEKIHKLFSKSDKDGKDK